MSSHAVASTAAAHNTYDENGVKRFQYLIDYSNFMEPKTDRVYYNKSRRLDFCRRKSHKSKLVMIIHFEGIIGEVKKRDLKDDSV